MTFVNTTIQNRSKKERLSSTHTAPSHYYSNEEVPKFLSKLLEMDQPKEKILFSLGVFLVGENSNSAYLQFLAEYDFELLHFSEVPVGETDLLGSSYQFLNTRMENLKNGSFYTGPDVAIDFISDLDFDHDQVIFDPSCGSGSFLFRSNAPAAQLVGVDADPIAVMIAKFNYFIKFPEAQYPRIYCEDFFTWFAKNQDSKFDYVIGNPPYGASLDLAKIPTQHISSGESFSYFIEFGFFLLKEGGVFRFLLPEAILNVKRHTDIRKFILKYAHLKRIKKYRQKFAGVMSDVYMLELSHEKHLEIDFQDEVTTSIPIEIFSNLKNQIFVNLNSDDLGIITKIEKLQDSDLSRCTFGLGVVTGDNKSKLQKEPAVGLEPIWTGKEVEKFRLNPPKNYIRFVREDLQQVAPDSLYRAPVKLIYKTISKTLKVAIDFSQILTTNSANLIIPDNTALDPYVILGILNSDLYSYLNLKLFGGVNKIAKENLMALPLPRLNDVTAKSFHEIVLKTCQSGNDEELQEFVNTKIFDLTAQEIEHIANTLK